MKKNFRWMTLALAACGAFLGCSDDNGSSPTFNMEKNFDIVLSKSSYVYKSKDSLLIVKKPVCKEVVDGGLKSLEWKKESSEADSVVAYNKKSRAYMILDDEEDLVYSYEGNTFPKGSWIDDSQNSIHYAKIFTADMVKETFQYDGSCFMKSFYSQLFKDNEALVGAESALGEFYLMFGDEEDSELDEKELVDNIRVPACDELTLYDGEVSVRVDQLKESSGKLSLRYKDESCMISFNLRYANNQGDCRAAYDEYKLDRNGAKAFDFDNYDKVVNYSYNCIAGLVQHLKDEKGSLRKQVASDEDAIEKVANSAVNLILSGLKK